MAAGLPPLSPGGALTTEPLGWGLAGLGRVPAVMAVGWSRVLGVGSVPVSAGGGLGALQKCLSFSLL